jgi:hypothetical protein
MEHQERSVSTGGAEAPIVLYAGNQVGNLLPILKE